MKTLYNYIRDINISTTLTEASLLDEIDDILADGDEIIQKKEIVEWIKDNDGFVQMFSSYKENNELYKDYNKLKIDSKNQININVFRPFYQYALLHNKKLNLPIPEFIKINNVNNYDFVGDKKYLSVINFNNLPHVNTIDNMLLRCWDGRYGAWVPDLSKLNADEIGLLIVDIEGVHPEKWPKSKLSCVHLFGNMITSYKEEYLEKVGYNYNLHNLNGLNTNELVIPDFFISENTSLLHFSVKKDIIINKDIHPYEWQNLNLLFNTKSFKKLYAYACSNHSGDRRYKEIKKVGDEFIIKGRATKVFDKYQSEIVYMKNLKDILEASILDVERTMEEADLAIINQFEDLKKFVLDKNNWKQTGSGRTSRYIEINYEKPINMLVKCLNINNPEIKYVQFKFYRNTMMKFYKGGIYLWGHKDYQIHYDPNSAYGQFESDVAIKTPQDVLTKLLKPIFKDFETFVETINTTLDSNKYNK